MSFCPKCLMNLPDSSGLCQRCGDVPSSSPLRVASDDVGSVCRMCGSLVQHGLQVCGQCGTPVIQSRTRKSRTNNFSRARVAHARSVLVAGISTAVLVTFGVGVYRYQHGSVSRRLESAIARGNLLTPIGENAYELYHEIKRTGVSPATLAQCEEKLLPMITAGPFHLLKEFAVPAGNEPPLQEWEDARKLLSWAAEMRPDDSSLAARANYCKGRIAYLDNRKDEALDLWKRADSQDRSWGLPTNGVGLILNERRDYQMARSYLYQAIRRDPNWAVPYNNVGTSFLYEKDYGEAEYYYRQAAQRAPGWGRPHFWLGDIATHSHEYARAVQEYEIGLSLTEARTTSIDLDRVREKLQKVRQLAAADQSALSNAQMR